MQAAKLTSHEFEASSLAAELTSRIEAAVQVWELDEAVLDVVGCDESSLSVRSSARLPRAGSAINV